jgi:hypothetical protein
MPYEHRATKLLRGNDRAAEITAIGRTSLFGDEPEKVGKRRKAAI